MINSIVVIVQFLMLGLMLWGLSRSMRRIPGPAPWPLTLAVDATGSPRLSFNFVLLGISVILLVVVFSTTPSRFTQRTQQLDRIEQLLREIRDEVRQ